MEDTPPNQFTEVAEIYDDLMSVVPYAWWAEYVQQLWRKFRLYPKRILDVACGTGNVTRELMKLGLQVEGVDYSADMLAIARRKVEGDVKFWHEDARTLELDTPPFDAAVCLFDSLNYLTEPGDLPRAFRAVRKNLVQGGPFVFDMNAIRALETGMFNQRGTGRSPDLEYDWESAWDPIDRLCTIRMEFQVREGPGEDDWRILEETHVQRGYTLEEILAGLRDNGFEVLGAYDAFTTRPPTGKSDRYHIIARAE